MRDGSCRGTVKGSTMVHDEEAEVSVGLATLVANSQRSKHGFGAVTKTSENPAQENVGASDADQTQTGGSINCPKANMLHGLKSQKKL